MKIAHHEINVSLSTLIRKLTSVSAKIARKALIAYELDHIHREKLCFTQFSIRMAA